MAKVFYKFVYSAQKNKLSFCTGKQKPEHCSPNTQEVYGEDFYA